MEQQNNTAALNDIAGVLPMDTGVIVNGIHDEIGNKPSSSTNAGGKKGRGRPPKSAGSTKATPIKSDTPKRARGRPAKAGESTPTPKTVVVAKTKKEEVSTNGDASKKKRGRPSKISTPNEQINGISKPQVQQPAPVSNHQEQENGDEPAKKKRGRPSGTLSPKKPVVSVSKETSSKKKRGRPSGTAIGKKSAPQPKAPASNVGSAKKRGRPKKAAAAVVAASSSVAVTPTPVTEATATVTPTNVQ